jgi:transposase-like protein
VVTWLSRARPLLGKVSDHEIARRLGIARTIVSKARRKLGVASVRRVQPRGRPWLAKVRPLLGKLSDREIARQTGIHFKTIGEGRRALGIPAVPKVPDRGARKRTGRYVRTNANVRRKLGIAPARRAASGPDRKWVPAIRHLLGRLSDREVAKQAGRHSKTVAIARRELGIAGYRKRPRVRGPRKTTLTKALLRSGRSTQDIARMTGIARQTISRRRKTVGIATSRRRTQK